MARMHHFIGLAALSFALTGCVTSTDKYTAVKLENEQLRTQLGEAQSQARSAQAQADTLKNQINAMMAGGDGKDALLQNNAAQIANLSAQLAEINGKYQEALGRVATGGIALPQPLTNALTSFAQSNPDIVDFDAARGIVKFKTDFTFATGSDTITEKAKAAISRFATILNSDAAKSYELMVAGHTDNTPVVNPQTKIKHPDNWYLSSHRAISVGDELIKHAVSPQRVAVVGYADQRPIASNTTTEGKAQNRRVEVLILPSTVRSTFVGGKTGTSARPSGKKSSDLNKDSSIASPDRGPALNK
jgi:chemotaxis protein MotB